MPSRPTNVSAATFSASLLHVGVEQPHRGQLPGGQPDHDHRARPCGVDRPRCRRWRLPRAQTFHRAGSVRRIGLSADRARHSSSATPAAPSTMLGSQTASHAGQQLALGHLAAAVVDHVVDEDDARCRARRRPACRRGRAARRAPGRSPPSTKHANGQRELAVQAIDGPCVDSPCARSSPARASSSGIVISLSPFRMSVARKHRVRVEAEDQLGEARDLVLGRVRERRGVARAVRRAPCPRCACRGRWPGGSVSAVNTVG